MSHVSAAWGPGGTTGTAEGHGQSSCEIVAWPAPGVCVHAYGQLTCWFYLYRIVAVELHLNWPVLPSTEFRIIIDMIMGQ